MSDNLQPIVRFEHVTFGYERGLPVLEDATFLLHPLESACIIGPNGGGKTTILNLLLGLLTPDAGTIEVFGQPPLKTRHRIGYMPQHMRFDPQFPVSALEVVLMGRLDHLRWGPSPRKERDAARAALAEVGMADLARQSFSALSGGQRQRVLIARALACEPDLLMLDEPTASVDPSAQDRFFDLLAQLNRRMAVLIVSHDLGFVSTRIRRVLCVNRTVRSHPTTEVTGQLIQDLYGGHLQMVHHDRCCEPEGGRT